MSFYQISIVLNIIYENIIYEHSTYYIKKWSQLKYSIIKTSILNNVNLETFYMLQKHYISLLKYYKKYMNSW